MAYARNQVDEDEYFSRVIHALGKCGTQVLLHLLQRRVGELTPTDHQNQPWSLDDFLNHKRTDILKFIGRDRRNKDVLYPFNQDTDLTKWDIPLFVFVLLNACELGENDSLKNDIRNLRDLRNAMFHNGRPLLDEPNYRFYYGRIFGAVERICDFMQEPELKKSLCTELDKYQSLRHTYPNGSRSSELGCKFGDMINLADAAFETCLQKIQHIIQKKGLPVYIPVVDVMVNIQNYNKEDERALTEQLVQKFSEALEHSTNMSADRSKLEVEVTTLVRKLLAEKKEIIKVSRGCVVLSIQCHTMDAVISLVQDNFSGKLGSLFENIEEVMRTNEDHALFEVCIGITSQSCLALLNELFSQVSSECEQRSYKEHSDGIFVRIQRFLQRFKKKKKKSSSSRERQETYMTIIEKLTLYLQQPGMEMDVLSPMQSKEDEEAPERSVIDQVDSVPRRIRLHYPSGKGTSDDREYRTVACPSDEEVSVKRSALICAAIDFGNTYTGYAFSPRHDQKKVITMTSKEGSSKLPTVVLFDQNKQFHSFGYKAKKHYEELLHLGNHREWYLFEKFKMKLFETKELEENTPVQDFGANKEMPAIDIFANAIKYIKRKLLKKLASQISGHGESDIHWVLTVPAIWNDSAKQFMRNAAKKAGISNEMLSIALEPEAASVYCREDFPLVGNVGTRYILLDLGGGTADITSHIVVKSGLKELHRPAGGGFGGADVEKNFKKLLVDIFGMTVVTRFKEKCWIQFWEMMADFEISKRNFDGKGNLVVDFPAQFSDIYGELGNIDDVLLNAGCSADIKVKNGRMFISKYKGQWIFDKTIEQVIETTQILLKVIGDVDYIVLVGGFSESKYLQTRMKEEFGEKVVSPAEPRTAVLRGAVLFGHCPAAIQTRVSKYTYGFAKMKHFVPGLHSEQKRILVDGHAYCDDIFEKHVTIGQEITVGQSMKEITYYPTKANQTQAALQVFASSKENPMYVTDEDCHQVGFLLVEMVTGGNRNFEIKVKLIFGGTEIQVEVRDRHGILIKEAWIDCLAWYRKSDFGYHH